MSVAIVDVTYPITSSASELVSVALRAATQSAGVNILKAGFPAISDVHALGLYDRTIMPIFSVDGLTLDKLAVVS